MFNPRCTNSLLKRLKLKSNPDPCPPTTRLGDWYANIIYARPKRLVLCVSERTLLPLLVAAAGPSPLELRIRDALAHALQSLSIPMEFIDAALLAMEGMTKILPGPQSTRFKRAVGVSGPSSAAAFSSSVRCEDREKGASVIDAFIGTLLQLHMSCTRSC